MGRYIDADELLKEYRERRDAAIKWNSDCDKEYKDRAEQAVLTFNECMLTLTNQPTADVVEIGKPYFYEEGYVLKDFHNDGVRCFVIERVKE